MGFANCSGLVTQLSGPVRALGEHAGKDATVLDVHGRRTSFALGPTLLGETDRSIHESLVHTHTNLPY